MKINANENVLLLNKKLRAMGAEPAPVPETTVSTPENTMKAMKVMGQQNVMFQGGMTKIVNKVGKNAPAWMAALMIAAPVIATTGCEKIWNGPVSVVVNIDDEQYAAAIKSLTEQLAALTVIVANMQANGAVQTELLRQQLAKMDDVYKELSEMRQELSDQGKTQDEIKTILDNYAKDSIEQMKVIAALLGTESPIYQAIMKISEQLDAGKISFEEAYNAMMEILKNIDNNVEAIKERVTDLVNEFKEYREDFNNAKDEFVQLIKEIKDGTITSIKEIVSEVKEFREEVKESKEGEQESLQKLIAVIQAADENNIKGNEEIVKQLEDLGISADMSKEEIIAAIEENTKAVNQYGDVLNLISSNTSVLPEMLEQHIITNGDLDKIMDAINNLEVTAELDPEVQAIIEKIADKMDEVIDAINTQGGNITNELKTVGADVSKIGAKVDDIDEKTDLALTYYQSIDDNVKALLEQAKETGSTVVDINVLAEQIGQDVAWIREHGGGGSGSTVDLSKLEAGVEQIIVELQAQQTKIDLMYAVQCKDSQEIKNISDKLDGLTDAVKDLLTNDESLLEFLETAFASINIKLDTNNETLAEILDAIGKIEDKMQVLIIIINMGTDESIKKYDGDSSKLEKILEQLLEEIENIVDEEEGTKSNTKSSTAFVKIPLRAMDDIYPVSKSHEAAVKLYTQTIQNKNDYKTTFDA